MNDSLLSLFINANTGEFDLDIDDISTRVFARYTERPGFFTRFKSGADFGTTLTNPVVEPVSALIAAGVFGVVAVVGAAVCLGALLVAGIAGIFGNSDFAGDAFAFGAIAGLTSLVCGLLTVGCALGAAVGLVTETTRLVTRTGTTLVSPIVDLFNSDEENLASTRMAI